MTNRSHLQRHSATKNEQPHASRRAPSFAVVLITPEGVQQLTFNEGDRAGIAVIGGQMVLQLGEGK